MATTANGSNLSPRQAKTVVLVGACAAAGAGAAVVLAAWFALNTAKQPALASDVWTAGWLLWLAGLPGLVLAFVLTGKVNGGPTLGFAAGMAVRLPAGGMLALNGVDWNLSSTQSFANVVATGYLVLLTIEVLCFGPAAKKAAAAMPPVSKDPAQAGDTQTEPKEL